MTDINSSTHLQKCHHQHGQFFCPIKTNYFLLGNKSSTLISRWWIFSVADASRTFLKITPSFVTCPQQMDLEQQEGGNRNVRESRVKSTDFWRIFFTHSLKSDLSRFEYYLAIIWKKLKCHWAFKVAQIWLFVLCPLSFVCCDAGLISSWMNFSQCYVPFSSFIRSNQSASRCFFFSLRLYFPHITWSHGHNASVFRNQPGAFVRSLSPLAVNSGEWSVFLF